MTVWLRPQNPIFNTLWQKEKVGLCLLLIIWAKQKLSWKTKKHNGLDGAFSHQGTQVLVADSSLSVTKSILILYPCGKRTAMLEIKSRPCGMQRREAGLVPEKRLASFLCGQRVWTRLWGPQSPAALCVVSKITHIFLVHSGIQKERRFWKAENKEHHEGVKNLLKQ